MVILKNEKVHELLEDLGSIKNNGSVSPRQEWLNAFATRWIDELNEASGSTQDEPFLHEVKEREVWIKPRDEVDAERMLQSHQLAMVLWSVLAIKIPRKLNSTNEMSGDYALKWIRDIIIDDLHEKGVNLDALVE